MPIQSWAAKRPPKSKNLPGQTVLPGLTALEPNTKQREEPEYLEQWALFECLKRHEKRFPVLHWVHAIPNGLALTPKTARKAQNQGVRAGIWDIFVPCRRALITDGSPVEYPGLYLEMKAGDNGLTEHQKAFAEHLDAEGYARRIAYTWIDAVFYICEYLGIRDPRIYQELHINRKGSIRYKTPDPV